MTDIPTFETGSAAELAWARAVLREKNQWRSVVSGDAVLAMARRIVANAELSSRAAPSLVPIKPVDDALVRRASLRRA